MNKYAIEVEEVKSKIFIVEAESLEESVDRVASAGIDLRDESCIQSVGPSQNALEGGIATEQQLSLCEVFD